MNLIDQTRSPPELQPIIEPTSTTLQRFGRHIKTIGKYAAIATGVVLAVAAVGVLAWALTPAAALLPNRNFRQMGSEASLTIHKIDTVSSRMHTPVMADVREMTKRHIQQQYTLATTDADYLFPSTLGVPAKSPTLCISGIEGVWRDANRTLLFLSNGTAIEHVQNASTTLTRELSSQQAIDSIQSVCGHGYYHFLTQEGNTTYHSAINNQTLAIAPYPTAIGIKPATMAKLLDNQAVVSWLNNATYYYEWTNSNGQIQGIGDSLNTAALPAMDPQAVSFTDGTSSLLRSSTLSGLYEFVFDAIGTFVANRDINERQNLSPIILPRTPIPADAQYIPILWPGPSGDTPTIFTWDRTARKIISSRVLGNEPASMPKPRMSHCGIYTATVRSSLDVPTGKFVMKFDMVDQNSNCSSVIGGEQVLSFPPATTQLFPEVGCFSNGVAMVTFEDDSGEPRNMMLWLDPASSTPTETPSPIAAPQPVSLPSPLPTQAPTPEALLPSPGSQTIVPISLEVDISIIGPTVTVPLHSVLIYSNNTVYITLIDPQGFEIIYAVNGSIVPSGTELDIPSLVNITISRGNASATDVPVFEACSADRLECTLSVPKRTSIQDTTNIEGIPLWAKIVGPAGTLAIIGLAAALGWRFGFSPEQKRRIAAYAAAKLRKERRAATPPRPTFEITEAEMDAAKDRAWERYMSKHLENPETPNSEV